MKIRTKHPATCPKCNLWYDAGATMVYDHRRGVTHCLSCWRKHLTGPERPVTVKKD